MKYLKLKELIKNNEEWINEKLNEDENYFGKLSSGQSPRYLMIGCSDSRVPLNSLLKAEPGEIFIHRNIANQVNLNDINLLSALEYSIEHLYIRHIIIVGHYSCGGVTASIDELDQGLIENWVAPIKDIYIRNASDFQGITDKQEAADKLSEINVVEQAKNIMKTPVYQRALRNKRFPMVHAWIFNMYTGKILRQEINEAKLIEEGILPDFYLEHIETNKTYYE